MGFQEAGGRSDHTIYQFSFLSFDSFRPNYFDEYFSKYYILRGTSHMEKVLRKTSQRVGVPAKGTPTDSKYREVSVNRNTATETPTLK